MKIKTIYILTILNIIISISLILVIMNITNNTIENKFYEMEDKQIEEITKSTLDKIEKQNDYLESVTRDWAKWDESYNFVKGTEPDYIEENLYEEALETLKLDFIIFFDSNGKYIYDLSNRETLKLIEELEKRSMSEATGIFLAGQKEYSISIQEITRSDSSKTNGFLVMGFENDNERLLVFSEDLNEKIDYILNGNEEIIKQRERIIIRKEVKTIFKENKVLIEVIRERDLTDNLNEVIEKNNHLLLYALLTFILIILATNIYFSKKFITPTSEVSKQLMKITNEEIDITNKKDLERALELIGDKSKNLESSNKKLERQVKNRIKELESTNSQLESTNKLFMNRELKMIELKKEIERLKKERK